jgi:hypothetical protein
MPRFVVLRHQTAEGVHFDFMLESAGVLKTWSLPQAPQPGTAIACTALPDHRLHYLDYDGPIAGERGEVARWDAGAYELGECNDSEWVAELAGKTLGGKATLCRDAAMTDRWTFSFTPLNRRDALL